MWHHLWKITSSPITIKSVCQWERNQIRCTDCILYVWTEVHWCYSLILPLLAWISRLCAKETKVWVQHFSLTKQITHLSGTVWEFKKLKDSQIIIWHTATSELHVTWKIVWWFITDSEPTARCDWNCRTCCSSPHTCGDNWTRATRRSVKGKIYLFRGTITVGNKSLLSLIQE